MKRLIRFEDAYGMADIVCIAHELGLINLSPQNSGLNGINTVYQSNKEDTYVECGVSFPAVLMASNDLIIKLVKYDIDELVIVYDMDSPKASQHIIKSGDLEIYLNDICEELNRQELSHVKIKLAPVVWSAETLAICIIMCSYEYKKQIEKYIEYTEIIHTKNTAKLHVKMIEEILRQNIDFFGDKKAKHIREYIIHEDIVPNLKKVLQQFPDSINKQLIRWIITQDANELYDICEAINHQKDIEVFYQNHLPKPNEQIQVFNVKLDLNKKCW